ncbi:MAG: hypothetical protein WCX30_00590 [Candidatus Paceibacterota bacterium]|jgi:hypothetical protein|nr:hypothetical protein [bacterium]
MIKKEKIRVMNDEAAEVATDLGEIIIFCITLKWAEDDFFEVSSRKINFIDENCDDPSMMKFENATGEWSEEVMKQYLEEHGYKVIKKRISK